MEDKTAKITSELNDKNYLRVMGFDIIIPEKYQDADYWAAVEEAKKHQIRFRDIGILFIRFGGELILPHDLKKIGWYINKETMKVYTKFT